ncbi:MAG: hypothetical protein ACKVG4_13920 [Longimicrobiales bacterium]|jgi:hypothetical protein
MGVGLRTHRSSFTSIKPLREPSSRLGHYFTGTLPSLDDSLLFIELEGKHVGLWLST